MNLECLPCSGRVEVLRPVCLGDHVEADKGIDRLYDQTYHKMRIHPVWIHHLFGDCCESSCNTWYGSEGGRKYRRHTRHNCVDVVPQRFPNPYNQETTDAVFLNHRVYNRGIPRSR